MAGFFFTCPFLFECFWIFERFIFSDVGFVVAIQNVFRCSLSNLLLAFAPFASVQHVLCLVNCDWLQQTLSFRRIFFCFCPLFPTFFCKASSKTIQPQKNRKTTSTSQGLLEWKSEERYRSFSGCQAMPTCNRSGKLSRKTWSTWTCKYWRNLHTHIPPVVQRACHSFNILQRSIWNNKQSLRKRNESAKTQNAQPKKRSRKEQSVEETKEEKKLQRAAKCQANKAKRFADKRRKLEQENGDCSLQNNDETNTKQTVGSHSWARTAEIQEFDRQGKTQESLYFMEQVLDRRRPIASREATVHAMQQAKTRSHLQKIISRWKKANEGELKTTPDRQEAAQEQQAHTCTQAVIVPKRWVHLDPICWGSSEFRNQKQIASVNYVWPRWTWSPQRPASRAAADVWCLQRHLQLMLALNQNPKNAKRFLESGSRRRTISVLMCLSIPKNGCKIACKSARTSNPRFQNNWKATVAKHKGKLSEVEMKFKSVKETKQTLSIHVQSLTWHRMLCVCVLIGFAGKQKKSLQNLGKGNLSSNAPRKKQGDKSRRKSRNGPGLQAASEQMVIHCTIASSCTAARDETTFFCYPFPCNAAVGNFNPKESSHWTQVCGLFDWVLAKGDVLEIGKRDVERLCRLAHHKDKLRSRIDTLHRQTPDDPSPKKRKKKFASSRQKTSDANRKLRQDMHWKVANFLCQNYDIILLPKLAVKQMTSNEQLRKRNISNDTARRMFLWSHYAIPHEAAAQGQAARSCCCFSWTKPSPPRRARGVASWTWRWAEKKCSIASNANCTSTATWQAHETYCCATFKNLLSAVGRLYSDSPGHSTCPIERGKRKTSKFRFWDGSFFFPTKHQRKGVYSNP